MTGTAEAAGVKHFDGHKGRYGLLHDTTLCVGCRSCEVACKEVNDLPPLEQPVGDMAVFDQERRTTDTDFTVVNRYDVDGANGPVFRKQQCNHCDEPACADDRYEDDDTRDDAREQDTAVRPGERHVVVGEPGPDVTQTGGPEQGVGYTIVPAAGAWPEQEILASDVIPRYMKAFKAKDWETLPRCGECYRNSTGAAVMKANVGSSSEPLRNATASTRSRASICSRVRSGRSGCRCARSISTRSRGASCFMSSGAMLIYRLMPVRRTWRRSKSFPSVARSTRGLDHRLSLVASVDLIEPRGSCGSLHQLRR